MKLAITLGDRSGPHAYIYAVTKDTLTILVRNGPMDAEDDSRMGCVTATRTAAGYDTEDAIRERMPMAAGPEAFGILRGLMSVEQFNFILNDASP